MSTEPPPEDDERVVQPEGSVDEAEVHEETFQLNEEAIASARVLVVASLLPMVAFEAGPGGDRLAAYAVLGVTLSYSVWVLLAEPYRRLEFLSTALFVSVTDALAIAAFLWTTGGFGSPYYLLWYVSIFALSFRYPALETFLGATFYVTAYSAITGFQGSLLANLEAFVLRSAFIYLSAALGYLLARVTFAQTVERRTYHNVAEKLRRSNEDLRQVSYAISHDVREPLRLISSYLDLLDRRVEERLEEDEEELLAEARDASVRLQQMIDDLLKYNRIQRTSEAWQAVDLDEALDGALDNLALEIEDSGTEVTRDPLPTVQGIESQLVLVFQNLVANAMKYAGDGPSIRVYAEETEEAWRIAVEDDGPGIPEEEQETIFELFHQGSNAEQGQGVGLALCQRICERHNGSLELDSTPGEGTTFWIVLPHPSMDAEPDAPA